MRRLVGKQCKATGVLIAVAFVAAACGSSKSASEPTATNPPTTEATATATTTATSVDTPTTTVVSTVPARFQVRPSAELVAVTQAEPGTSIELTSAAGMSVGIADDLGNLVFRNVDPGDGYVVTDTTADPMAVSEPFRVPALDEVADRSFYSSQTLVEGLNYIEMRDGVTLAAMVRLPGPASEGPYPTVIEYSGYDPANPSQPEPMTGVFGTVGFATVGVNMRGSGCSGGAFGFFTDLQSIDGYDMVEVIASQPWVLGNKVGMVGISYPGISQLFVAQTRPPSLAAISPMSVIEDAYRSVVYPGGIYNNGFAKSWGDSRQGSTEAYGQTWIEDQVDSGDTVCEANQLLRSQNIDLTEMAASFTYYSADPGDGLAPRTFVDRINVPVFLAGAWQDEQTGSRFATMLDDFTDAPVMEVYLYNGAHADSANPLTLGRLFEFMDVYVARRTPAISPLIRVGAPALFRAVFGADGLNLPPDRFTSLEEAKAALETDQPIHLLLEMGGNSQSIGGPMPRAEMLFDSWPPPAAQTTTWALAPEGRLIGSDSLPIDGGAETFTVDVARSQVITPAADSDGNEFNNLDWPALDEDKYLGYTTEPFTDDALLAGSGSVSLWIESSAKDADLQVTITEIRPDGKEMFVQSGWLRASHRALDPERSTELVPFQTHAESDVAPLPAGEFTRIDVEIFPVAHVFRAGSRLRLIVDSPGGNRNLWKFDVLANDGETITVATGGQTPSRLILPLLVGVDVPAGLPPCPGTRSQPCRAAVG